MGSSKESLFSANVETYDVWMDSSLVTLYKREFSVASDREALYMGAAALLGLAPERVEILKGALARWRGAGSPSWTGILQEAHQNLPWESMVATARSQGVAPESIVGPYRAILSNKEDFWRTLSQWQF